jgi:hypothetical protein
VSESRTAVAATSRFLDYKPAYFNFRCKYVKISLYFRRMIGFIIRYFASFVLDANDYRQLYVFLPSGKYVCLSDYLLEIFEFHSLHGLQPPHFSLDIDPPLRPYVEVRPRLAPVDPVFFLSFSPVCALRQFSTLSSTTSQPAW